MVPKLTYFNSKGLSETIRLMFKYGDIEFEDVRIERVDWPKLKLDAPFGEMPFYEEDGKRVNQSGAISRYVAKKVKLVGKDDWEDLEIDSIVDTLTDIRTKIIKALLEPNEEVKSKLIKVLIEETFPFYLERLNKQAVGGYFINGKLTWADFHGLIILEAVELVTKKKLNPDYPNLAKVIENVTNIPQIKKWIEVRPITVT
nr:glutathione S-transferase-like [Onthophagus taurus]